MGLLAVPERIFWFLSRLICQLDAGVHDLDYFNHLQCRTFIIKIDIGKRKMLKETQNIIVLT